MNSLLKKNATENELAKKIRDRIRWDSRISLADLTIDVKNGVVIVSGYLDSTFKRNAALEVISGTEGVWSVEDRMVVPLDYYRSDEELEKIVQAGLAEMIKIGDEHIEAEVRDGIVKLQGEVYRPRLKAMADCAVWELSGVRDCLNFIEIKDPPHRVSLHAVEPTDIQKGVFDGVN